MARRAWGHGVVWNIPGMACVEIPNATKHSEDHMSAPNTNVEKQKKNHVGPLVGIAAAVIFGVGIIFYWYAADVSDEPVGGAETEQAAPEATGSATETAN